MDSLNGQEVVDPRVKEALDKRRYYAAVVTVLEDGSFAVFATDRHSESMIIVDNPDDLVLAIASRYKMKQRVVPSKEQILGELKDQLKKMNRADTDGSGGRSGRPAVTKGKNKADFTDLFS